METAGLRINSLLVFSSMNKNMRLLKLLSNLFTKLSCSISTRPAPQQASRRNHCPPRSTAFHR